MNDEPEEDGPEIFDATAAHLQHDDFVGTVAIDDMGLLTGLLKRAGIDADAWQILGLGTSLTSGHGRIRFYLVDRRDLAEAGNIARLVDADGRIPVKVLHVDDPGGAIVREGLLPLVKGAVIEVVHGRVRKEGWQLRVAEDEQ